jgi:signal transduction histidine kinase
MHEMHFLMPLPTTLSKGQSRLFGQSVKRSVTVHTIIEPEHEMTPSPLPLERLRFFLKELNVDETLFSSLEPFRETFIGRKKEMAEFLYATMFKIAQTNIVFEGQTTPERLKRTWEFWFERLWLHNSAEELLASVWQSGMTHVRLGIDHRFISLAYAQVRRYCHRIVGEIVPVPEQRRILETVNSLIDLSILVETDAFITSGAQCARQVIMGVAHQIRNPIMVIGGFATRLRKQALAHPGDLASLDSILGESKRLQRLVEYAVNYMHILDREASFSRIPLLPFVESALERSLDHFPLIRPRITIELDPDLPDAEADTYLLEEILLHVLNNCMEALDPADPWVRIISSPNPRIDSFISLEIANSGALPREEFPDQLFNPFHSTKPFGTGLGLPMAKLAAQKMFGTVTLSSLPENGTLCSITLPLPGAVDPSGLYIRTTL